MKASELRIGNYISPLGVGIDRVLFIDARDNTIECENFSERPIEDFNPIPLNEEWLVKFGFKKIGGKESYLWVLNGFELSEISSGFFIEFGSDNKKTFFPLYIHQLQNLIYALSGEELTIKETLK
jgi:hypothetical protein